MKIQVSISQEEYDGLYLAAAMGCVNQPLAQAIHEKISEQLAAFGQHPELIKEALLKDNIQPDSTIISVEFVLDPSLECLS